MVGRLQTGELLSGRSPVLWKECSRKPPFPLLAPAGAARAADQGRGGVGGWQAGGEHSGWGKTGLIGEKAEK